MTVSTNNYDDTIFFFKSNTQQIEINESFTLKYKLNIQDVPFESTPRVNQKKG